MCGLFWCSCISPSYTSHIPHSMCIRFLTVKHEILGVEHPETIRAIGNLAAIYYFLGKYTKAEKMQMEVLDAMNRILGVDH